MQQLEVTRSVGNGQDFLEVADAITIAVNRHIEFVLGIGWATFSFVEISPTIVVIVHVLNQSSGRIAPQFVRHTITIGIEIGSSVVREGIWTCFTVIDWESRSSWSIADAITIGIGIPCIGSRVVGIDVGACVGLNRVVQTITIDIIVNRIADEVAIEIGWNIRTVQWVGETFTLDDIGEAIAIVVKVFDQTTARVSILGQFVRQTIKVRILQDADLNNEFIVEQTAVGIDGEVGQLHQLGRCSPNGSIISTEEQAFWQVWFDFKG